ncbi:hypothetical protein ATANTOWER_024353 [Ataeniobius toweri]|uniref:LAGLIDADG homing endonuclease n=1 Tax=Ataeniobius toweri TaxID=208326 RepID=A0ABU7A7W3_9TELE|nr:hypothetical protein [Ataeniobius toweri]
MVKYDTKALIGQCLIDFFVMNGNGNSVRSEQENTTRLFSLRTDLQKFYCKLNKSSQRTDKPGDFRYIKKNSAVMEIQYSNLSLDEST